MKRNVDLLHYFDGALVRLVTLRLGADRLGAALFGALDVFVDVDLAVGADVDLVGLVVFFAGVADDLEDRLGVEREETRSI